MVVKVSKPEINVREKISELDKPSGTAGQAMLAAETPQEQFNLISAGRRNLLHNSQFMISQRGDYVTNPLAIAGGTPTFTVDRWFTYANGATSSAQIFNTTLPTGENVKSLKTIYTGSTAGSWLHPSQKIEPEYWMRGQPITLSAWVRTNIADYRLRICDTINCYMIGDAIPSDGEWHYITATHILPDNMLLHEDSTSNNLQIQPAFQTTGQTLVQNESFVEFALMQAEIGPKATPFDYRTYAEELALCQRYFERYYPAAQMPIYNESSVSNHKWIRIFHTIKRSVPSLAGHSGIVNKSTSGLGTISSITRQSGSLNEMSIRVGMSGSTGTSNAIYHFDPVAGSAYFDLDSEFI